MLGTGLDDVVLLGKTAMTRGTILVSPRGVLGVLAGDRRALGFSEPLVPALLDSSLVRRRGCWEGSTGVFSLSALLSLCPLRAATLLECRRPLLSGKVMKETKHQNCKLYTCPYRQPNIYSPKSGIVALKELLG